MINKNLQDLTLKNDKENKDLINIENKKNILNEQINNLNKEIKRIQRHTITNHEVVKKLSSFQYQGYTIDNIITLTEDILIFHTNDNTGYKLINSQNDIIPIKYNGNEITNNSNSIINIFTNENKDIFYLLHYQKDTNGNHNFLLYNLNIEDATLSNEQKITLTSSLEIPTNLTINNFQKLQTLYNNQIFLSNVSLLHETMNDILSFFILNIKDYTLTYYRSESLNKYIINGETKIIYRIIHDTEFYEGQDKGNILIRFEEFKNYDISLTPVENTESYGTRYLDVPLSEYIKYNFNLTALNNNNKLTYFDNEGWPMLINNEKYFLNLINPKTGPKPSIISKKEDKNIAFLKGISYKSCYGFCVSNNMNIYFYNDYSQILIIEDLEHYILLDLSSLNIVRYYYGAFKEYKLIALNKTETANGTTIYYYDIYKFYPKSVPMLLNGKVATKTYEIESIK